jgi:hypothetical protein
VNPKPVAVIPLVILGRIHLTEARPANTPRPDGEQRGDYRKKLQHDLVAACEVKLVFLGDHNGSFGYLASLVVWEIAIPLVGFYPAVFLELFNICFGLGQASCVRCSHGHTNPSSLAMMERKASDERNGDSHVPFKKP